MAYYLTLLELAIASGVSYATLSHFRAHPPTTSWWWVIGTAGVVGGVAGVGLGFLSGYQVAPHVIFYSFPIPAAYLVLETSPDGSQQWIDFITPAPLLTGIANAALLFCLPIGLATLVHWFVGRKRPAQKTQAHEGGLIETVRG